MQANFPVGQSSSPLRSRTVLEIIDASFRIYRENFLTLITLTALIIIPVTILQLVFNVGSSTTGANLNAAALNTTLGLTCIASLVSIILSLLQTTVLNGVITVIASERQFGHRLSLGQAWAEARPRLGTLAWGFVYFYILVGALTLAIGLGSALCQLLLVLFAIVVYLAITVGALLPSVAMLEGYRGSEAMRRTIAVARPRFWQIIGFSLLVGIISLVFSFVLGGVLGGLIGATAGRGVITTQQQVLTTLISSVINIFLLPITPIGMTLLYYDSRIRTEGLDLALQSLGEDARPGNVPPPFPKTLFEGQDYINMIILGVTVVVASLLFAGAVSTFVNTIAPGLGNLVR